MGTEPLSDHRRVRRILWGYLILAALLALLLGLLHLPYSDVRIGRIRWFNLDTERNLPTWFSGALLFLFGCSACVAWSWERRRKAGGEACFRLPVLWLAVAAAGFLMSLDEITILHENVLWKETRLFSEEHGETLKYLTQWQLVWGAPVVLGVLFVVVFFINRYSASKTALFCGLSGIAFWLVAFLLEGIRGALKLAGDQQYELAMVAEEGLEMLGTLLLVASVLFYTTDIALDFTEPRRRRLQTGALLLTRKTLGAVVATLVCISAIGGSMYYFARQQADRDAPVSGLHKRAVREAAREAARERRSISE